MPTPDHYAWAEALDSFCICIAVGAGRKQLAEAFGAMPESEQLANAAELWQMADLHAGGNDVVQIGTLGSCAVAFEPNGWTGLDGDVIKRIAADTSVSIYRNVNAVMSVVVARNGVIVRSFDPLLYNPDGALPEEARFTFGTARPIAAAFALAELLTGIPIAQAWLLDAARLAYRRKSE